tara:strand:- start:92 stop:1396 length:1305 start_codon:yes stop_codon:yes gene_type:complete
MAWPFDNQADSVLPIDYGVQKLASYANNAMGNNQNTNNRNLKTWPRYDRNNTSALLPNNQNNSGLAWWMNADRGRYPSPMMPGMLDQTGEMGAYTNTPRTPEGIPFHPDQGNRGRWSQQNVPDETGIMENLKNKLSGFTTPTIEFLKSIGGEMSPEKRAEIEAIQGSADQYGWGNLPGTDLQANIWSGGSGGDKVYVRAPDGTMILRDKNKQSAFGSKTIGDMVTKKENWMQGQFDKYGDQWTDDEHKGLSTKLYNYAKRKGLIDQWRGTTPVDTASGGATTIGAITGGDTTGGGSTYTGPPTTSFNQAQFARSGGQRADKPGGFTDPGRGSYGPHMAYGGRIGYQEGELVEDEYMAEATPGGMMEENIEEVQGEPSREQLEAIALEIFRLPLEELNEEQLNVVYQAAMEQEPAEEEVQFAAQEGPGEGIASLV